MTRRSVRTLVLPVVLAAAAATALGGCGIAETQPAPGTAAKVEDVSISVGTIDEAVTDACAYLADNPQAGSQESSRGELRQRFTAQLIQRAAVEQMLDETGVVMRDQYAADITDLDATISAQLGDAPDDQVTAIRLSEEATRYVRNGLISIGESLLRDETGSEPVDQESGTRGETELDAWLKSHDVEINPQFGLRIDGDGKLVDDASSSSLSVPVASPASDDVSGLPPGQVCG